MFARTPVWSSAVPQALLGEERAWYTMYAHASTVSIYRSSLSINFAISWRRLKWLHHHVDYTLVRQSVLTTLRYLVKRAWLSTYMGASASCVEFQWSRAMATQIRVCRRCMDKFLSLERELAKFQELMHSRYSMLTRKRAKETSGVDGVSPNTEKSRPQRSCARWLFPSEW